MSAELVKRLQADKKTNAVDCRHLLVDSEGGLKFTFMGSGGESAHIWLPFSVYHQTDHDLSLDHNAMCSYNQPNAQLLV